MDLWQWIVTSTSVDNMLTAAGLGSLALLFAADRILTKGQHLRRVADLIAHHERERAALEQRTADALESRDGWKEAARVERERADRATASVSKLGDTQEEILHVFRSLDRALPPHPVGGESS
jgi:hypothetical protein